MGSMVAIDSYRHNLKRERDEYMKEIVYLKEELNLQKQMANISASTTENLLQIITAYETKIRELDKQNQALNDLNTTLYITSQLVIQHETFLNGNPRTEFIAMANIEEFNDQINKIKAKFKKNQILPVVQLEDLIFMSQIYRKINGTYMALVIKIPILSKKPLQLRNYIALPFKKGNKTFRVNLDGSLFTEVNANEYKIVPIKTLDHCNIYKNLTICNSLLKRTFKKPTQCELEVVVNETANNCGSYEIEHKNYLIEIDEMWMFCYIIEPILMKLTCESSQTFVNLTKMN